MPAEVVEGLGAGRRPAVHVGIGPHTYRSTITPRGGVFMIPLSAENRAAARVSAGDEVVVPEELAAALAAVDGAKAPETRQRRVAKAVEMLRTGQR